ncbi:hypothetical protein D3C75_936180 [compost metagenome]
MHFGVQRFIGAGVVAGCFLLAIVGAVELEREFVGGIPVQGRVDRVFGDDAQRFAGFLVF